MAVVIVLQMTRLVRITGETGLYLCACIRCVQAMRSGVKVAISNQTPYSHSSHQANLFTDGKHVSVFFFPKAAQW